MKVKNTHTAPIINTDCIPVDYEELLDSIEDRIFETNQNIELPLVHTFTPGLYSREIFVPKGALLTSKVHKQAHQFLLLKGEMVVISEEGAFKITAPFHGTTMPGSTRLGVALQDSIWTTFHKCNIVKDKDYTQEELIKILPEIEKELVEDRRPLNMIQK